MYKPFAIVWAILVVALVGHHAVAAVTFGSGTADNAYDSVGTYATGWTFTQATADGVFAADGQYSSHYVQNDAMLSLQGYNLSPKRNFRGYIRGNSSVDFVSGYFEDFRMYGTSTTWLYQDSEVGRFFELYENATLHMHGVTYHGAATRFLLIGDNATLNLYGTDMVISDDLGTHDDWETRTITGKWMDGTEFTLPIRIASTENASRGIYTGSTFTDGSSEPGNINLNIVPEPASMALLGLGGVMLLARRSARRRD